MRALEIISFIFVLISLFPRISLLVCMRAILAFEILTEMASFMLFLAVVICPRIFALFTHCTSEYGDGAL